VIIDIFTGLRDGCTSQT